MKTVVAKINAGVPNYRMKDKIIPPPANDEKGKFINSKVWPRFTEGSFKGKLIHGGYVIVKGEKYKIPSDYKLKDDKGKPVGLGMIFEEVKKIKE